MSVFCNVIMLLLGLLYVHVCVTRTGWKTRPRPKTVILSIKKSKKSKKSNLSSCYSVCLCQSVCLSSSFLTDHFFCFIVSFVHSLRSHACIRMQVCGIFHILIVLSLIILFSNECRPKEILHIGD